MVFFMGIFVKNRMEVQIGIQGASALLNVAANFILIPFFGRQGAAFATLIASVFAFCALVALAKRINPMPKIAWTNFWIAVLFVLMFGYGTLWIDVRHPQTLGLFLVSLVSVAFFYLPRLKKVICGHLRFDC